MASTEDEPQLPENPNAIGALVARLEHLTGELHDRFTTLEDSLGPIVVLTPPTDPIDPATIDYRSQTASNLLGIIFRLEALGAAMTDLRDRIDL